MPYSNCIAATSLNMTSELDSSLTSIDWLPNLGMSSLRSGKERGERKRERGKERDTPLSIPSSSPTPNSSKGKPPHSYATLIAMAISSSPERKLSLNDIYTWISNTFPFYSRAGRGWKVVHWAYTIIQTTIFIVSLGVLNVYHIFGRICNYIWT